MGVRLGYGHLSYNSLSIAYSSSKVMFWFLISLLCDHEDLVNFSDYLNWLFLKVAIRLSV